MVKIKLSRLVLPLARNVRVRFGCFACSWVIRFEVMGINALGNGSLKHTAGVNNRLRLWFAGVCMLPQSYLANSKVVINPKKRVGLCVFSIHPA